MTDYVKFKIENNTPALIYHKGDIDKKITTQDENLITLMQKIATALEMGDISNNTTELLAIPIESDEGYVIFDVVTDNESSEFKLESKLNLKLNSTDLVTHRLYAEEMSQLDDAVKEELTKNHKHDLFSSFLAYLYDTMIDKVRLALEDLELDQLHIEGLEDHPILIERLSKAMEHLGVDVTYYHVEE